MRRSVGLIVVFALFTSVLTSAQQIYNADDPGVTPPTVVKRVEPQYTQDARAAKVEGEVVLRAVVTSGGVVGGADVVKPLDPDLDTAAMDALLQWEFKPGTKDGKAVDVRMDFPFKFSLE
jgi:TonB family protein